MAAPILMNYLMFNNEEWCSSIVDNVKALQTEDPFIVNMIRYLEQTETEDSEYELMFGLLCNHWGKVIVPKCHVKALIQATHLMFNTYQKYHIDALKIKKQLSRNLHIDNINQEIKSVLNACHCTKQKTIRL